MFIYRFFHPVCHQLADRSLHIFGEPLAVCARCSSIYGAFLVGTVLYPALRTIQAPRYPSRGVLLAAAVPIVVDVISGMIGFHAVSSATRLLSGATFGLVAPFFVIPAAIEALQQIYTRVVPAPLVQPQKGQPNA